MEDREEYLKKLKRKEKYKIVIFLFEIIILVFIIIGIEENFEPRSSQMNIEEMEMYNSMIKKYIGVKKSTEVQQMIEDIISQNNQYVGESGRFISINVKTIYDEESETEVSTITGYDNIYKLKHLCELADSYDGGENNQKNIDNASNEMRMLKKKITSKQNYEVYIDEKGEIDGRIHKVTIRGYNDNTN